MTVAALASSAFALPRGSHGLPCSERLRAAAANSTEARSLSKPCAVPVRVQVTLPMSAWRAFDRRVRRLRQHADAVIETNGAHDAGDGARGGVVDALGRRAFDGRAQHGRVEHAGNLHVDRVLRAAVDLVGQLDAHGVVADQAERAGRFEIGGRDARRLRAALRRRRRSRRRSNGGRTSRARRRSAPSSARRPARSAGARRCR